MRRAHGPVLSLRKWNLLAPGGFCTVRSSLPRLWGRDWWHYVLGTSSTAGFGLVVFAKRKGEKGGEEEEEEGERLRPAGADRGGCVGGDAQVLEARRAAAGRGGGGTREEGSQPETCKGNDFMRPLCNRIGVMDHPRRGVAAGLGRA